MPIQVTCTGCHTRFQVSEKFAGRKGPCPKCKTVITIPSEKDKVVVHAPDEYGPAKDAAGRPVLKPISRTDMKVSPVVLTGIIGGVFVTFLAALIIGWGRDVKENPVPTPILAFGALALAAPLALGGYQFLRDDELEPFRGMSLYVRVGICAVVYAVLWGAWSLLRYLWFGPNADLELLQYCIVLPPLVAAGGLAAFACFDLEYMSGVFHYGFYLAVTVLLRLAMHMPPL